MIFIENPTKKNSINLEIAEATHWGTGELVAFGFSIFFSLIMVSAFADIVLGGAITSFLAGSIPFIASVVSFVSFPAFPILVSLISAIAVCACLLSLTLFQYKQLKNIVTQVTTLTNQQKNENGTKKDISEINKSKDKTGKKINLENPDDQIK